jgi:hypothetical protein
MEEKIHEKRRSSNPMKFVGVLLPFLPKLLFRFGIVFLGFKRKANKAGRVFRTELIKQGVDRDTATELTDTYMKTSQLKTLLQTFR